jgi:hypothetical protein
MAFILYHDTSQLFHSAIDWASGHNWASADGGKYVAEITKNALTGPVTFSISILFGSLVGLTISTLYNRQTALQRLFVTLHQEGRELQQLLIEFYPEESTIRKEGLVLLECFVHRIDRTLHAPDQSTEAALRKTSELMALTRLVCREVDNKANADAHNAVAQEQIRACIQRLKACRIDLWGAWSNNFSIAHYVNMVVLAFGLLFVFLLQTDNGTMQFLIDFQLSICWALLIGSYALLAAVIWDLRSVASNLSTRLDQREAFLDVGEEG